LKNEGEGEEESRLHEQSLQDDNRATNVASNVFEEEEYKIAISCPNMDFETSSQQKEDSEASGNKENYSQNDMTRYEKVLQYIANNEEYLHHQQENEGRNSYENVVNAFNSQRNNKIQERDESKSINISHISEVSRSKEKSETHSMPKYRKPSYNTSSDQRISESDLKEPSSNTAQQLIVDTSSKVKQTSQSYVPNLSSIEDTSERRVIVEKDKVTLVRQQKPTDTQSKPSGSSGKNEKSKVSNLSAHRDKQSSKAEVSRSQRNVDISRKNESQKSYKRHSKTSLFDESEYKTEDLGGDMDDALKYEVIKEFKRLYGDKYDKLFINSKGATSPILETIVRTIKVARQKMVKMGLDNIDPDDLQVSNML
jgi:hypothetical protein